MLKRVMELCLRFRFLRVVLDALKIRSLLNAWLHRFPRFRHLHSPSLQTRMRSVDSLLVDREIFEQREYEGILPLIGVETFADLGCNCGFFTCYLAHSLNRKDVAGLLIDGNPEMVREAQWHVQRNQLANVRTAWGIVGADLEAKSEAFYLHPDAAGSSRFPKSPEGRVTHDQWTRIDAPVLSLAVEWRKHFGERSCDLLKIDIEGSEQAFLTREAQFVSSAKLLVIEVHHWLVDEAALERQLENIKFRVGKVLSSSAEADVRLYVKA